MTDSPVATRWVAAPDTWSRNGAPIRAVVIHMAEGGGTVSWLTRNDGNSSHYVVEYDGECVQMVLESRAAGSINPNALRTGNDAPFTYLGETITYGKTAAVNSIGAAGYANPNVYVIAVEVEGFAATGPNAKQRATLQRLVNDIRRRRGAMEALGHRDFQSYKACPGHHIPWVDYGGHAKSVGYVATPPPISPTPGADVIPQFLVPETPTQVVLKEDTTRPGNSVWIYTTSACTKDGKEISLQPIRPLGLVGFASADVYMVAYEGTTADADTTSKVYFAKVTDIARTQPYPKDCTAEVTAATSKLTTQVQTLKAKAKGHAAQDVADANAFATDIANT